MPVVIFVTVAIHNKKQFLHAFQSYMPHTMMEKYYVL